MQRDWPTIALIAAALVLLIGGYTWTSWTHGWGAGMMGPGMMGAGRGGGPGMGGGWMQQMHNRMMGGGGPESIPDAPARPDAPVVERTLAIREWSIAPADLTVPAGTRLVLTIQNEGEMFHNLAIPDLGVRLVNIPSGATRQVEVYVEEPGTYPYLCDIPGHAQAGQQGTLTVTDAR